MGINTRSLLDSTYQFFWSEARSRFYMENLQKVHVEAETLMLSLLTLDIAVIDYRLSFTYQSGRVRNGYNPHSVVD